MTICLVLVKSLRVWWIFITLRLDLLYSGTYWIDSGLPATRGKVSQYSDSVLKCLLKGLGTREIVFVRQVVPRVVGVVSTYDRSSFGVSLSFLATKCSPLGHQVVSSSDRSSLGIWGSFLATTGRALGHQGIFPLRQVVLWSVWVVPRHKSYLKIRRNASILVSFPITFT